MYYILYIFSSLFMPSWTSEEDLKEAFHFLHYQGRVYILLSHLRSKANVSEKTGLIIHLPRNIYSECCRLQMMRIILLHIYDNLLQSVSSTEVVNN